MRDRLISLFITGRQRVRPQTDGSSLRSFTSFGALFKGNRGAAASRRANGLQSKAAALGPSVGDSSVAMAFLSAPTEQLRKRPKRQCYSSRALAAPPMTCTVASQS